ncbi:MAG: phosphoribosylanthranilate isomerase, partial [Pseudomonadota bacterium]
MPCRVKICGISTAEAVQAAVASGSDAIGLMFYPPSKRHLEISQAAELSRAAGPYVTVCGVFVDPEPDYLRAVCAKVGLDCLQFHGDETAEFCRDFGRPYIKAFRIDQQTDEDLRAAESHYPDCQGILLDTHVSGSYGGTGVTFDWNRVNYGGRKPVVLAGGLTTANVV